MKCTSILRVFLVLCFLYSKLAISDSSEHFGTLENQIYTSSDKSLTTLLPSLDGEFRDYKNSVSVYDASIGKQYTLEYNNISSEQLDKYKQQGAKNYLSSFTRGELINNRYKNSFNTVNILSEDLKVVNSLPLLITTITLPNSSPLTNREGQKKDMIAALGTSIQNNKVITYHILKTHIGTGNKKHALDKMKEKIIDWADNTNYKKTARL